MAATAMNECSRVGGVLASTSDLRIRGRYGSAPQLGGVVLHNLTEGHVATRHRRVGCVGGMAFDSSERPAAMA